MGARSATCFLFRTILWIPAGSGGGRIRQRKKKQEKNERWSRQGHRQKREEKKKAVIYTGAVSQDSPARKNLGVKNIWIDFRHGKTQGTTDIFSTAPPMSKFLFALLLKKNETSPLPSDAHAFISRVGRRFRQQLRCSRAYTQPGQDMRAGALGTRPPTSARCK